MAEHNKEHNSHAPRASSFSSEDNNKITALIAAALIVVLVCVVLVIGLTNSADQISTAEVESEGVQDSQIPEDEALEQEVPSVDEQTFFEINSVAEIPSIFIKSLDVDDQGDWLLEVGLDGFTLSKDLDDEFGDGYISVLINNQEFKKLFSNQLTLSSVEKGDSITVVLKTKDNESYIFDEQILQDKDIIGGVELDPSQRQGSADILPEGDIEI